MLGGSLRGWATGANGRVERGRNSAELGVVWLEEDNECGVLPGCRPPGDQDGGRSVGTWVDRDPREQGTEETRLGPGSIWVAEPGAWRDAAGLWLLLAPCTELHLRAVKGSDFRKRCKRSF
ncbi:hypothetical protein NN561_005059 [Cricetulus griseus]